MAHTDLLKVARNDLIKSLVRFLLLGLHVVPFLVLIEGNLALSAEVVKTDKILVP